MDGLAIAASLREVRTAIEGGFIRSIYQPTRNAFLLHVFAGRNQRILLAPRHAAVHVTELDLPNPPKPSTFVMLLRRHLRGGRIIAVRQRGWDRVVTFGIERHDGRVPQRYELVVELIGVRGNLFLLENGKVLGSAHRDPRNRPGDVHVSLRPQDRVDPAMMSAQQLADLLRAEPAIRVLTRSIDGIGRRTAQDLLRELDEDAGHEVQAAALHASIRGILAYVDEPSPHVVVDAGLARAAFYPLPPPAEPTSTFGEALDAVSGLAAEWVDGEADMLLRDLRRKITRQTRTLEKLREWLDNAGEAERLQSLADLLMIHHAEIEPKAEQAVVIDPATERKVTIRLLPSLSAIENAQRLYERAKRLRRGRPHVTSRIARLEREIRMLERAIADHEVGRVIDDEVLALLPRTAKRADAPKPGGGRPRIEIDGFTILVGRSAADNDRLVRQAAPDDLWFHAKGYAGSHVIIRRGGQREIPESVINHAARLAARHSKARTERRVEVVSTAAKHLRKPKGAAPGLVNVSKSDTLTVEL